MAKHYKIHPAIGIARVGNSARTFTASEIPGARQVGPFRDDTPEKSLMRQAARFRIFEYDDATPDDPGTDVTNSTEIEDIEWTVEIANKKAEWFKFDGLTGEGPAGYPAGHPRRNDGVKNRRQLMILPGPRSVSGRGARAEFRKGTAPAGYTESFPAAFSDGRAIETLGSIETDDQRRLTVAGGFGISGSPSGASIPSYANNDDWFDDVSDGPVTAKITLTSGGSPIEVAPAWIIVGPPDYAPEVGNIVTMQDVLYDLGVRKFDLDPTLFDAGAFKTSYKPSFTNDIFPILKRAFDYKWVHGDVRGRHDDMEKFAQLAAPPSSGSDHGFIFEMLRKPADANSQGIDDDGLMPKLYGDTGEGSSALVLTETQYFFMDQWRKGKFVADWAGIPQPATEISARGLDIAAMEACVGGAFFPGIEAGWIMRDSRVFLSPFDFRLAHGAAPEGVQTGDLTKRSALPWQADFHDCANYWWPAQRPESLRPQGSNQPVRWGRGVESFGAGDQGHQNMVADWHGLGFYLNTGTVEAPAFEEKDRTLPEPETPIA